MNEEYCEEESEINSLDVIESYLIGLKSCVKAFNLIFPTDYAPRCLKISIYYTEAFISFSDIPNTNLSMSVLQQAINSYKNAITYLEPRSVQDGLTQEAISVHYECFLRVSQILAELLLNEFENRNR